MERSLPFGLAQSANNVMDALHASYANSMDIFILVLNLHLFRIREIDSCRNVLHYWTVMIFWNTVFCTLVYKLHPIFWLGDLAQHTFLIKFCWKTRLMDILQQILNEWLSLIKWFWKIHIDDKSLPANSNMYCNVTICKIPSIYRILYSACNYHLSA